MEGSKLTKRNGFTLLETLIAIVLIAFVAISILGAFPQIKWNTGRVGDRNLALVLAESRMEELLKYPGSQLSFAMPATTTIDYAVKTANSFTLSAADPDVKNQFRRTTTVTTVGNLFNVLVTVEYGFNGGGYPSRITLNSRRGG